MKRLLLAILTLLAVGGIAYYLFGPPNNRQDPQTEVAPAAPPAEEEGIAPYPEDSSDGAQNEHGEGPSPQPQIDTETQAVATESTGEGEEPPSEQEQASVLVVPSFDVVRVDRDGNVVAAGRSEPGSEVELLSGDQVVARAQTDARGEWVMAPPEALTSGGHELSLRSRRDEQERESEDVVVVSVPEKQRSGPPDDALASREEQGSEPITDDRDEQPLAVLLPRNSAPEILQGPVDGLEVGELALESLSYDDHGRLQIAGRVAPKGRVHVYIDNGFVGRSEGDDDGRWALAPRDSLAEGLHDLRIDQVDDEGRVLARLETPFVRSSFAGSPGPGERFVVVQPGNSLWRIARGRYGEGMRYTLIFEANRKQIRDPDLIYPGQIFLVPEEG